MSPRHVAGHAGPRRAGGGVIVNRSSTAGLQGYGGLTAYVASEWRRRHGPGVGTAFGRGGFRPLAGRLDGLAVRVPVQDCGLVDLTVERDATVESVKEASRAWSW